MTPNQFKIIYSERVLPGAAYYLAGLVIPTISTLIALPFLDDLLWLVPALTYGVYLALGILFAPAIKITSQDLQVAKASLPLSFVSDAKEIAVSETFLERGPKLNAKAYFRFQVGVKGLVKVRVNDSNDPTPYWLFSSRNPDLVVRFLNKQV